MGQYITFLYIITYCIHTYRSCYLLRMYVHAYVVIGAEYVHVLCSDVVWLCMGWGGGGDGRVHPYMIVAPGLLLLLTLTSHWPIQSAQSKCT